MARRKDALSILVSIGRDIRRANKRAQAEQRRSERAAEVAQRKRLREDQKIRARAARERERNQSASVKASNKKAKADQQRHAHRLEELKENLTPETVKVYCLGKRAQRNNTEIFDFSLKNELKRVSESNSGSAFRAKYGSLKSERLILNGDFSSVLGLSGLNQFRKDLDVLKLNIDQPLPQAELNQLRDYVFVCLFQSGTFLVDTEDGSSSGWLNAFRYLAKNFEFSGDEESDEDTVVKFINGIELPTRDKTLATEGARRTLITKLGRDSDKVIEILSRAVKLLNSKRLAG